MPTSMGNLMGAAVSNLYYPASDRTVGGTLGRGFTVTAQAIIGSEVIEFWPDIVRHHKRKQAEKLARQGIQGGVQNPASPAPQSAPRRLPPSPENCPLSGRYLHHARPAGPHPLASLRTQIFR